MNETPTLTVGEIMAANAHYAVGTVLPRGARPRRSVAIVTCMDVRIDPLPVLGFAPGEAHVIRNAGARVTDDVIRSLAISQQALGTRAIILMPHTRCGLQGFEDNAVRPRPGAPADSALACLGFHDLEATLRADVAALRESPWIAYDVMIIGLEFDVDTGRVHPVPGDAEQACAQY